MSVLSDGSIQPLPAVSQGAEAYISGDVRTRGVFRRETARARAAADAGHGAGEKVSQWKTPLTVIPAGGHEVRVT